MPLPPPPLVFGAQKKPGLDRVKLSLAWRFDLYPKLFLKGYETPTPNPAGHRLFSFLNDFSLSQLVDPIRYASDFSSSSTLDLVATNRQDLITQVEVSDPFSDYCPVVTELELPRKTHTQRTILVPNCKQADWEGFRQNVVHSSLLEAIQATSDVKVLGKYFQTFYHLDPRKRTSIECSTELESPRCEFFLFFKLLSRHSHDKLERGEIATRTTFLLTAPLSFTFLTSNFPTLFVFLNCILWSGYFLKIPSEKRKISEKPPKTP